MLKFAGFPLSAWAFALRIWTAMMLALYAGFWLQLGSASSAAVTVGVLALPTRGETYQKAIYRVLGTGVGVVVSIIIAALFAQARDLFVIAYASWLGLCVYVGGLLDGNRAAGVFLSGYTVAIVAVAQIDSPQNIFLAGVNRGAAIVVGIAALALISDVFFAPDFREVLSAKLAALHQRVRTFALAILQGESMDPVQSANLLREITALHPDISALVIETSAGWARGAAATTAAVALVAEVSAANAIASLPATTLPSLRSVLARALATKPREDSGTLRLRLQQHMTAGDPGTNDAHFAGHAVELLTENQRAQDAIQDLEAGRHAACQAQAPIYRSHQVAARHGICAFAAVLIAAILFSLGGWPFASHLAMTGIFVALSVKTPNPRKFAGAAVVAIPIAALLAGVTEFLVLNGVDQFPLLVIGMAPSVLAAALLLTLPNATLSTIGFLVLIYYPLLLSLTNPQDYNPESYLFGSFFSITSVILAFAVLWTILPTSDGLRRRWYLTSTRVELRDLLTGRRSRHRDDDALFRDADRTGQLAALQPADGDERRDDLRWALNVFGLAAAVRRVQTALAKLSGQTDEDLLEAGYAALADCSAARLREAAALLARSAATQRDHDSRAAARTAAADLSWAAFLVDASRQFRTNPQVSP